MLDYSTILMRIERTTKSLEQKCLHKRFEGFNSDIAQIHSDLTLLAMWAVNQEAIDIFNDAMGVKE
jgi:hypothetical protein